MSKFKPSIICVGSNIESLKVLEELVKIEAHISGLVTLPEQKETIGSDYKNLNTFAIENKIPCHFTSDINSKTTKSYISKANPDYIFILGWSQILDSELINTVKAIFGSHPSVLPYGAGRAPVPWTVLEEQTISAVSIFNVTNEVDAGDIFYQEPFEIPEGSDSNVLYQLVASALARGFVKVYNDILNDSLKATSQDHNNRTVRAKRIPDDGFLDFNESAQNLNLLVKATTTPFPGAFTFLDGTKIIILESEVPSENYHKGVPGQILKKEKDNLLVQCGDGVILLKKLRNEDYDNVEISSFKLGSRLGFVPSIEIISLQKEIKEIKKVLKRNGLY